MPTCRKCAKVLSSNEVKGHVCGQVASKPAKKESTAPKKRVKATDGTKD